MIQPRSLVQPFRKQATCLQVFVLLSCSITSLDGQKTPLCVIVNRPKRPGSTHGAVKWGQMGSGDSRLATSRRPLFTERDTKRIESLNVLYTICAQALPSVRA